MFCYICHKKIRVKKYLYNLFQLETHHICEYCLEKYPVMVQYQVIPLDYYKVHWYSLLQTDEKLEGMAYMSFLKPFYLDFLKMKDKPIYLYFDQISDKLITILQSLEHHVYLVTLYDNINAKEHAYVI